MRIIFFDGSNLVRRAQHVLDLHTSDGRSVGGVFGYVRTLKFLMSKYRDYSPIVVWDGGSVRRRIISNSEYKANRASYQGGEPTEEIKAVWANLKDAKTVTKLLGIPSLQLKGYESDDIIAHLSMRNREDCVIISSDKDFFQLLHFDGISLDRPGEDEPLYKRNFQDRRKYTPLQYRLQHIICGDSGDNVSGIDGVGAKTAFEVAREFDDSTLFPLDLGAIVYHCSKSYSKRVRKIADAEEELERNFYLVDLIQIPLIDKKSLEVLKQQLGTASITDVRGVAEFFHRSEFVSFATDFFDRLLSVVDGSFRNSERVAV